MPTNKIRILQPHIFMKIYILVCIIIFILILWVSYYFLKDLEYLQSFKYLNLVYVSLLQLWVIIFYYIYTNISSNVIVITEDILWYYHKKSIFSWNIDKLQYFDIKSINVEINGMFANLIWFWNIKIKTNSDKDIIIKYVEQPIEIAESITKIVNNK